MDQPGLFGVLVERVGVAVAAEQRALVLLDGLADDLVGGLARVDLVAHMLQAVGHGRVDHGQRERDVLVPADGAELEAVAAPGERRGAVAVLQIGAHIGDRRDDLDLLTLGSVSGKAAALGNRLHMGFEVLAEMERDDRRRRFLGAEPVVVAPRSTRRSAADRRAC